MILFQLEDESVKRLPAPMIQLMVRSRLNIIKTFTFIRLKKLYMCMKYVSLIKILLDTEFVFVCLLTLFSIELYESIQTIGDQAIKSSIFRFTNQY